MSEFGMIEITEKNDVFTIEIGGLDGKTHAGLARVFRRAHESDSRVVVVTGKNKKFLAPEQYEFEWVKKLGIYKDMLQIFKEAEDIVRDQINCEKVTIAKVYAPGAHSMGASIALACDFVYASDDSTFSDPHLSGFGVPPGDGGALLWPTRIGLSRAREFLMTDRVATAKEAYDIGLINKVVPRDELDAAVDTLIAKLLSYDPLGLKMTKKWLNNYLQQNMNIVGMGSLFAEGMVLASGNFAQKTEAYGKQLEAEGKRKG
ncbi:MAG: enoyl-CoA hydratase/isomerase family protein [Myxococcaceae bacterium]